MKSPRLFALAILCTALGTSGSLAGQPVPITDLFNTGVDNNRVSLPDNAFDPHFTFATTPPTGTVPIVATSAGGFPIAPWLGDSPISAWITPSTDATGASGDYTYRTTFTVPTGVDPSQVYLTGRLTSDNSTVAVLINEVATGITGPGNFPAFDAPFSIQTGFVTGVNTLDFVVNENGGGPSGLRAELFGQMGPVGQIGIPGLLNTGVDNFGSVLADDAPDTHFTLSGTLPGPPIVARSIGGFPIPPWLGDTFNSAWITPAANTEGPEGDYFYDMTFDMTGLDLSTASIFGRWSTDNFGTDIFLNGVSTGNLNSAQFNVWTDFSISTAEGDVFLPGVNTLRFAVNNGAPTGPTGVRVEFLSSTAAAAVPEPSTALLTLVGFGFFLRRRRRRP